MASERYVRSIIFLSRAACLSVSTVMRRTLDFNLAKAIDGEWNA